MHSSIVILFVALFATISASALVPVGGGCSGSDPCSACSSCKGCKHCAKQGGTCGTCKPVPEPISFDNISGEWDAQVSSKADGKSKATVKIVANSDFVVVTMGEKVYSFPRDNVKFAGTTSCTAKAVESGNVTLKMVRVESGYNGQINDNGNVIQIRLRD